MANIFLISDTHFGHENIIRYCNRPFSCAEEMDETLVRRWNFVVHPSDHVYHLGDVAMKKQQLAIVQRLNGHKRLVFGNHDIFEAKHYLAAGFEKVCGLRVIDGFLMSHIPVHPGSLGRFVGNLHGHIHQQPSPEGRYMNLSVEVIGYMPVAFEDVKKRFAA